MSNVSPLKPLADLLAGRWQIPLALAAVALGSYTLWRLVPAVPPANFDALMTEVTLLEQNGDAVGAADAAANLLATQPPLPQPQQAVLHDHLAELIYRTERDLPEHNPRNVKQILEHQRAAADLGAPQSAATALRCALAYQWLGEEDAALREFRALLKQELPVDDRRVAVQAVVSLLEKRPEAKLERRQVLENLLDDESVPPAYLWWGLQCALRDALDEHDTIRARELLARHGARLKNSDLKGYLDYLNACVMLHEGRVEEAEPLVRWIDDWLGSEKRSSRQLDDYGHLPSLNRWLMGRIHLAQDRPADALQAFDDALQWKADPDLRVAALAGRGLALGALGRHAPACEAFRAALEAARATLVDHARATVELRQALQQLFENQRKAHDYGAAAEYLVLAAELTPDTESPRKAELLETLGQVYRQAAQQADDPDAARPYHAHAAASFERAARLAPFDDPRQAELLWSSAEEYDCAGQNADARRMLERFVEGRTTHPRIPAALVRLGQACEAGGDPQQALYWYTRATREFPSLEEAARAKVLSAQVLVSLSGDRTPEAEETLTGLLAGGDVAPEAAVYRDALLALCDLLYGCGRYAEAISRLEEFLGRYPDDAERARARFLLADAHRRSGHALRDHPPAGVTPEAAAAESRARLRTAADLYARLVADLDAAGRPDGASALYTRLALFYGGDCLFELNEPDTLREALATYRHAAARYEGQPAALNAQVQIANALLRLGEVNEAARAVERARLLLRSIPADAFTSVDGRNRADWERYLSAVSSSDLFQEVFGSPR